MISYNSVRLLIQQTTASHLLIVKHLSEIDKCQYIDSYLCEVLHSKTDKIEKEAKDLLHQDEISSSGGFEHFLEF